MKFAPTKWVLKRDIQGQIHYYNPTVKEWTEYVIYCRYPVELLHSLRNHIFKYEPLVRYDATLDRWEHAPYWNDDRHPSDILYTIESIV